MFSHPTNKMTAQCHWFSILEITEGLLHLALCGCVTHSSNTHNRFNHNRNVIFIFVASTQANWSGTTDDFQTCRAEGKGTLISGAEITKWTENFAELCVSPEKKQLYHHQKHPPGFFHHLLKFVITKNNVKNSNFKKQAKIILSSSSS